MEFIKLFKNIKSIYTLIEYSKGKGDCKMNHKFIKGASVVALSTGVLFSGWQNTSYSHMVEAKSVSRVEQVLSALTPAQREAINQLKISDKSGLQVLPELNLDCEELTTVIVEFKAKPQKTAVIVAETEGSSLTVAEAKAKVDSSHETFQNDLKKIFSKELKQKKNPYTIKHSYKQAFNGVAMTLPANKVKALLKSGAVQSIWSDMNVQVEPPVNVQNSTEQAETHTMVTFPGIEKLHHEGYTGKGVKIGILDTGIDYNHPDLKDAFVGGYDFVDNDNDPMETSYDDWKKSGQDEKRSNGSTYYTEHGTHVAGIIAGQGKNEADSPVKGVAPDADIYSYRVLGPYGSGFTSAILAAIDKAVTDGMDIVNMSLGASVNDPLYATSIAVNNAVLAGVTAVVSAGNSGDRMYSLGSPGTSPLAITVGASDTSITVPTYSGTAHASTGDLPADMKLVANGFTDKIEDFGGQTLQLVNVSFGGEASYWMGGNGTSTPIDVNGKVVLAQRGSYAIAEIIATAKKHGAKGVILYNPDNDQQGQVYLGEGFNSIPTFLLNYSQAKAIAAKLPLFGALKGTSIGLTFGNMNEVVTEGDKLASFSSRGPSRVLYDIKPEVTALGVYVYSTVPSYVHGQDQIGNYQYAYERLSGTSMAAPNVAGVAALVKQANPDFQPTDIKATLMNTADKLNEDYSVYEVGAGRVNPYDAVHAQTEIQVKDKTVTLSDRAATNANGMTTLADKGLKTIKNITGGISFGSQTVEDGDLTDSRSITLNNNSNKDKTFNVKVHFQTLNARFNGDSRASNDAAANDVTLDIESSVKVKRNGQANMEAAINVPKTAKLGTYEGYIVYTNKENPEESYQIPFGIHTVEEGIDHITGAPPAFTIAYEAGHPLTRWSVGLNFQFKSHMRTFDLFLVDPKTNEEIGFLGTANGMGADENVEYYFRGVFNEGLYYPLTGDAENPIAYDFKRVNPGLWKIKMVGTNDEGETFSKETPVYYGIEEPEVNMNLDAGGIYETANSSDTTFTVTGSVFDKEIEEMKAAGIPASQGDNYFVYYNPNNSQEKQIPVDAEGNFNAEIPLAKGGPVVLPITQYDFYDVSKATVKNFASIRDIYYVKKGTAYSTAISDKRNLNMGETTTVTFSMKNVKTRVKQVEYSFLYPSQFLDVVSVKANEKYKGNLDVQYTSTPYNNSHNKMTITATATGDLAAAGMTGDVSLVDLTFKAKDLYYKGPMTFTNPAGANRFFSAKYTNVDNSTVTTQGIQPYFYITPNYSLLRGSVMAEGLMTFSGLELAKKLDYTKAGAKISVTDQAGKEYGVSDPLGYVGNTPASFSTRLPITDKTFTLKMDVPGHFTIKKNFTIGLNEDGKLIAGSKPVDYAYMPGGDVNKDNVIDVNDALYIQANWGTEKREADINYDGKVDENDMQYVINNYLMKNPWEVNSPTPKQKYKGKSLEDVLLDVGM